MMKRFVSSILFLLIVMFYTCSIYAAGIDIMSENGGRVAIFDDITVSKENAGDTVSVFGDIIVDNIVNGGVVSVWGDITINSMVNGDVVSVFGNVRLRSDAVVHGNIVSVGSIEKRTGAAVYGEEIRIKTGEYAEEFVFILFVAYIIVCAFITLGAGLILITALKNKFNRELVDIQNNIGRKIAVGFIIFLVATIIVMVLFLTFIIPLMYLVLLILASIAASIFFGVVILRAFGTDKNLYLYFITGLITTTLIKVIIVYLLFQYDFLFAAVSFIMFSILVNSFGLGMIFDSKIFKHT